MNTISTLVLDLDGLMVDSELAYRKAAREALLEQGFILTDEFCDRLKPD